VQDLEKTTPSYLKAMSGAACIPTIVRQFAEKQSFEINRFSILVSPIGCFI
jgi:hypothetical protein